MPAPPVYEEVPAETYTETIEIDPMTREWVDGYGNRYVGPNAVYCADGSAPVEVDFGFPDMCAIDASEFEAYPWSGNFSLDKDFEPQSPRFN